MTPQSEGEELSDEQAERIARAFHAAYEELAPEHGYETREASRKFWADVPERNRALMIGTVKRLALTGVLVPASQLQSLEAALERLRAAAAAAHPFTATSHQPELYRATHEAAKLLAQSPRPTGGHD